MAEKVEIRLTKTGAVEVKMARRWPAYSVNIVTRETVPPDAWQNILVTCDGSEKAKGLRVFIDGGECFRASRWWPERHSRRSWRRRKLCKRAFSGCVEIGDRFFEQRCS